jgi:hypothetical protein
MQVGSDQHKVATTTQGGEQTTQIENEQCKVEAGKQQCKVGIT